MYNKSKMLKLLSVILVVCLLFTLENFPVSYASAQDVSAEDKTLIEERIKELNNKLNSLDKQSADTQEYLAVLNEKIVLLGDELDGLSAEMQKNKNDVEALKKKHAENETEIAASKTEIARLSTQLKQEEAKFGENYDLYCKHLYAMYVSGETSWLAFLLQSKDISQLLIRYEMVKRVAEQDGNLLQAIQTGMDDLSARKAELTEKQSSLTAKQTELEQTTVKIEETILDLQNQQMTIDKKRTSLSGERAEANVLLKKLGDEKQIYTEYLEDNKDTLDEIDRALQEAEKELVTTTATKPTTMTTTTRPHSQTTDGSGGQSTTKQTTASTTKGDSGSSKYISLTYPVPSQKKVTCSMHDYAGHSGCDFSCATGSRVVAAESGTVIISADLTNEDGSYRSYGRYIVIAHDKPTKSGNKVYTLYAHNSERLVAAGTYVQKGQQIAKSGSTGNSTGPHLHFEVRTPSSAYADCKDPELYLP